MPSNVCAAAAALKSQRRPINLPKPLSRGDVHTHVTGCQNNGILLHFEVHKFASKLCKGTKPIVCLSAGLTSGSSNRRTCDPLLLELLESVCAGPCIEYADISCRAIAATSSCNSPGTMLVRWSLALQRQLAKA